MNESGINFGFTYLNIHDFVQSGNFIFNIVLFAMLFFGAI